MRTNARTRRGQHMVEFALVLPVLITLFCAIVDLGWIFFQDHSINTACRNAARKGAAETTMTDAQIRTQIRAFCPWGTFTDVDIPVTVVDAQGNPQSGNPRTSGFELRVQVIHPIKFFTPIQTMFQSVNVSTLRADSQYIIE